jgi:hypothetical protein
VLRWLSPAGLLAHGRDEEGYTMSTDVIDRVPAGSKPLLDPLMDTYVRLAPGMQTRVDRFTGDIPLFTVSAGRTHIVISFDATELADLGAEHQALADEFVKAARAWRDELREVLAAKETATES